MGDSALLAGVIGGLGPDATVDFMARIVALTPAKTDQDHVRLLVDQNPKVPNRQNAILHGDDSPGPALAAMAAGLEAAGCDFIVMPCNTAHAYQDDISGAIRIPFISIIDTSIDALPAGTATVALMATPACLKTGLYQAALRTRAKTCLMHDPDELDQLMELTYAIKRGERGSSIAMSMQSLTKVLASRGAEAIIIACTEIPLVLNCEQLELPAVSSTEELAKRTVQLARGDLPLPESQP